MHIVQNMHNNYAHKKLSVFYEILYFLHLLVITVVASEPVSQPVSIRGDLHICLNFAIFIQESVCSSYTYIFQAEFLSLIPNFHEEKDADIDRRRFAGCYFKRREVLLSLKLYPFLLSSLMMT